MNSEKVNYLKGDDETNLDKNIEFIVATDLHYISPKADVDGELSEICEADRKSVV